jgi:hypothetical protein
MADYPNSIVSPRAVVNKSGVTYDATKTDTLFAEDVNDPNAEIVAIETELGTNPKSSDADVAARLDRIEGEIPTGIMTKIAETTLVANATSYTFSDLDGDADVEYMIVVRLVVNTASDAWFGFRFNGDTGANYIGAFHAWYGNANSGESGTYDYVPLMRIYNNAVGSAFIGIARLFAKSGFHRPLIIDGHYYSTGAMQGHYKWLNTADNITSITFFSWVADALKIGTHIELWALR